MSHGALSTTVKTYIHIGVEDQRSALQAAGFWGEATG